MRNKELLRYSLVCTGWWPSAWVAESSGGATNEDALGGGRHHLRIVIPASCCRSDLYCLSSETPGEVQGILQTVAAVLPLTAELKQRLSSRDQFQDALTMRES